MDLIFNIILYLFSPHIDQLLRRTRAEKFLRNTLHIYRRRLKRKNVNVRKKRYGETFGRVRDGVLLSVH